MSFQAYLDTVRTKTGKTPEDLSASASDRGLLVDGQIADGVRATEITDWLKAEYGLGHGHAMAIYAWFKGKRA
ncbi:DUF4287 domain-containing protein [Brevundimonas variabilis]|uniref:DUF4287 domain-containing protein n=1 Tax=Brevundimonas variabilis TaxID=74312 RepID=A0A7W9CG04_9CAUL|nr:DUF4287 domain-containing protein [Brevundimonas variabilis]MBB5744781.1 hypothetical protein [Brevundimonas variabilis]